MSDNAQTVEDQAVVEPEQVNETAIVPDFEAELRKALEENIDEVNVEEPEQEEVDDIVEDEPVEQQAEQPEQLVSEQPEEIDTTIIETYKDLDLENELIQDAINHLEGGETVSWVRKPQSKMTESEREAFRSVQSRHGKRLYNEKIQKEQAQQVQQPVNESTKRYSAQEWEQLENIRRNQPELYNQLEEMSNKIYGEKKVEQHQVAQPKEYSIPENLMQELAEAQDSMNPQETAKTMANILDDMNKHYQSQQINLKQEILREIEMKKIQETEEQKVQEIVNKVKRLREEDNRIDKFLIPDGTFDANGDPWTPLTRVMSMGRNPITGESLNDPEAAFEYLLDMQRGGKRLNLKGRPSSSAQPPAGAVEASQDGFSREFMAKSFAEQLDEIASNEFN